MSKQLEDDIASSIGWLVDGALNLMRHALPHERYVTSLMDKVETVTACAELPGDLPLRVRCFPRAFELQA